MNALTVAALTALHALAHRIGLTRAEAALLDAEGTTLSPQVWQSTVSLLADADAAGEGATLHLGFERPVLAWLGCRDEADCRDRYGLTVPDALAADTGHLLAVAQAVAGDQHIPDRVAREVLPHLVEAWCERSMRLAGSADDDLAVAAFDRAVAVCPFSPETVRRLWRGFMEACQVHGNEELARCVRARLARVPDDLPDAASLHGLPAALVFSVLWAITHGAFTLESERELDHHIERSPDEWERIRAAVAEGRVNDIPIPVETARGWWAAEGPDEEALRTCIALSPGEHLLRLVAAVEGMWGGEDRDDSLPEDALRHCLEIAQFRHLSVERDYRAPPGERWNLFLEARQGARRPETVERLALIHALNSLLIRYRHVDPRSDMLVHLALAVECGARGEHDETFRHIEKARRGARLVEDGTRHEHADFALAQHVWHRGKVDDSLALLAELTTYPACDLRTQIAAKAGERSHLSQLVSRHARDGDFGTWCAVPLAEFEAGHFIAAERTANAICRAHPDDPRAWTTLAEVLHRYGRHRDAAAPARRAVELSEGAPEAHAFLARILSRIGPDGDSEALEAAQACIAARMWMGKGPPEELALLADIVCVRAAREPDALPYARAADDLVWGQREKCDPPTEWLGAAAARRCQRAWTADAAAWLSRLAEAPPAAVARWVVDRVDYLQYLRAFVGELTLGPARTLEDEGLIVDRLEEAAGALGYTAEVLHCSRQGDERPAPLCVDSSPSSCDWEPHLAQVEGAFGRALVVRLRASEAAQRAVQSVVARADSSAVVLVTAVQVFECEKRGWIRWVAEQTQVRALLDEGSALAPDTVARLARVIELARLNGEQLRRACWMTPWHAVGR